jgi:putative acetyltransferase
LSESVSIESAASEHHAAIAALTLEAFGGPYEPDLIEKLRRDGLVVAELVALEEGDVVGHILFSRLDVEVGGRGVEAAALAPMAVRPDHQRQGIGGGLIRRGLADCRKMGIAAVIVLGHPDYYPRFGFSAARARHLATPFPGEAFMALELAPGALDGGGGSVTYPHAFGIADQRQADR